VEAAMSIKAMKQALEALEEYQAKGPPFMSCDAAVAALRAAIEQYDQTSLELCEECGWKAIIPGDGCLVCARQKPVAWMYDFMADNRDEVIRDWMTQDYADIARENGFNVRPLYTAPSAVTQKPVAYADSRIHGWPDCFVMEPDPPHTVPLYTAPREWVGLTDQQVLELADKHLYGGENYRILDFYKSIEARLKNQNA